MTKIIRQRRKIEEQIWLVLFTPLLLFGNIAMVVLFPACHGLGMLSETGYTPGIYEGSGQGYQGPVHVQVQLSPAGIEDIVITDHEESAYPGLAAMEELLDLVLETGSLDLDAISGATYSSRGFLDAVEDAVGQAMGLYHGQTEAGDVSY